MTCIEEEIRRLCMQKDIVDMLGGPTYTAEIRRHLQQYQQFLQKGLPEKRRFGLGTYSLRSGLVAGYFSFTVLDNANPTAYERACIGLEGRLDYVQGKKIAVHPDFRGSGLSGELLSIGLTVAKHSGKDFVADFKAENHAVIIFLEKHHITILHEWITLKGTRMYRAGIANEEIFL